MVFTSVTPTDLTKVFAEDVKTTVYFYNASNWSGVGIHGYNDSVSGQYTGDWNTTFMEKDGINMKLMQMYLKITLMLYSLIRVTRKEIMLHIEAYVR